MGKLSVAVIGGGPGGYVAAIRAAQLGAEVTLIEKQKMGGTCLNVGCIPTKVLLETASMLTKAKGASGIGVEMSPVLNWDKVQKRRVNVSSALVKGIDGLMRSNGIKVVKGRAEFINSDTIKVHGEGEPVVVKADKIIIATGSQPVKPNIPGINNDFCIDSTAVLALPQVPESMLIVGGGVIGVEIADAYNSFGTKVTVVEMMDRILPNMDVELSSMLLKDMKKKGITFYLGSKVESFDKEDGKPYCMISADGKQERIYADKMLISIGRSPYIDGLELQNAGISFNKKGIESDEQLQTSVPNIYAIGDCNGKILLAHAASEQGVIAAENCMGKNKSYDTSNCPGCVYTSPEFASVGMTEERVKELGIDYVVGKFPLVANGKSMIMQETSGTVKLIADRKHGEVLGAHILGSHATELIAELTLAIKLEATLDEIIDTVHAHPTVNESIHEAALNAQGRAIHILNRKL